MICLQSLVSINLNKLQLIDKSNFLIVAQLLLSHYQLDVNT